MGVTRTSKIWTFADDEEFTNHVAECDSMSNIIRRAGLNPRGGHTKTVKQRIKELNLSTDHFNPSKGRVNRNKLSAQEVKDLYLRKGSRIASNNLKHHLLTKGFLEESCSMCPVVNEWQGSRLVLHLDHIDGDCSNNLLGNLRLLCPNCHSQTPTYAGKNNKKKKVDEIEIVN